MKNKTCIECGQELFGRADKRFCSDHCRATYNNRKNSVSSTMIKEINRQLRTNYRILSSYNVRGKTRIHKDQLLSSGFNFNYFTNTYKTRSGKVYYFCYDQGYRKQEDGYLTLMKREEYAY